MKNEGGGGVFHFIPLPFFTVLFRYRIDPLRVPLALTEARGRRGSKEGEVSDPPFFVLRTSRRVRQFFTSFSTGVPCGGVAHFSVTTLVFPAGRLG